MITNPDNFKYLVHKPLGTWTSPRILPAVDGTAAALADCYEDYPYLAEMGRERYEWNNGAGSSPGSFDPWDLTDSRAEIFGSGGFIALARQLGVYTGISPTSPYPVIVDRALVSPEWVPQVFLAKQDSEGNALAAWVSDAGLARASDIFLDPQTGSYRSHVPWPVEADTLRPLYYDLARMKRYVKTQSPIWVSGYPFDSKATFSSILSGDSPPDEHVNNYFESVVDRPGDIRAQAYPSAQVNFSSGATTVYGQSIVRSMFRIPFATHPATGALLTGLKRYLYFSWNFSYSQDGATLGKYGSMVMEAGSVNLTSSSDSLNLFGGYCDLDLSDGTILAAALNNYLCARYLEGLPEWSNRKSADVYLYGILFDTGLIDHNSSIPSSWTWTPS